MGQGSLSRSSRDALLRGGASQERLCGRALFCTRYLFAGRILCAPWRGGRTPSAAHVLRRSEGRGRGGRICLPRKGDLYGLGDVAAGDVFRLSARMAQKSPSRPLQKGKEAVAHRRLHRLLSHGGTPLRPLLRRPHGALRYSQLPLLSRAVRTVRHRPGAVLSDRSERRRCGTGAADVPCGMGGQRSPSLS